VAAKLRLRSLKRCQVLLPRLLQTTRDEPIVGIDGTIAALGQVGGILRRSTPSRQCLREASRSTSSCSAAARVAAILTGSSAAMKARATAVSICTAPIVRQ
jgi:hypothetical protein